MIKFSNANDSKILLDREKNDVTSTNAVSERKRSIRKLTFSASTCGQL